MDASWTTTILARPLAPSSSQAYRNVTSFGHHVRSAGDLAGQGFGPCSKRKNNVRMLRQRSLVKFNPSVLKAMKCSPGMTPVSMAHQYLQASILRCDRGCDGNWPVTSLAKSIAAVSSIASVFATYTSSPILQPVIHNERVCFLRSENVALLVYQ